VQIVVKFFAQYTCRLFFHSSVIVFDVSE